MTVKIYRVKHATNASGFSYEVVWSTAAGRRKQPFADPDKALKEAQLKAGQLAAGRVGGAEMTGSDRDELQAARKLAGSKPLLTALGEWQRASELTGGLVLAACEAWSKKYSTRIRRVLASDAIDEFIRFKNAKGNEGDRTYGSKLKPIRAFFAGRYLDDIAASEWETYLTQWSDGVTANDFRKRAVALCRWARDLGGYLTRGIKLEIEHTERRKEVATDIGILAPATWLKCLRWVEANRVEHLAAMVLAGFCGLRADEIHGKRGDRSKRQLWEDIDLAQKHLNVSVAKTNTPSWRLVPICEAAVDWLERCPGDHTGPVCIPGAMEKIRWLLLHAGFELPDNCFRHSFITYKIAVTGDKAKTATEAGNSVKEIDRRYRRPQLPATGRAWFSSRPNSN